jgi:LacI family transcriptional regulator
MTITKNIYNSKAVKLSQQLCFDIQRGEFPPGSLIPAQQELALKYSVSRRTITRALSILAEEKTIQKMAQGKLMIPRGDNASGICNEMEGGASSSQATAKKISIAAVIASVPHYPTTQRLNGTKRYADANNLKFSHFLVPSHEEALDILARVEEYDLDGIIVAPFQDERYLRALETLSEKKFPVVLQNRLASLPLCSVMSSDGVGAYQATHYLIKKYRRPVYYLCGPAETEIAPERHQGYISAMKDAGMEGVIEEYTFRMTISDVDTNYWIAGKNSFAGFEAADRLFSKIQFPVSIFCENDFDAQGVYEAAAKHHLVVGKDVMVVGFDDYPLAQLITPTLTTCHAFLEDLGYEAGRLLHRLIKAELQPPVHIRIPMELVIRDSA